MEFLNIGGGELLVIALLALVLFGPEDIVKMMRTIGKYARQARDMWSQFSSGIQQELQTEEIKEALADTQATVSEAQDALKSLTASVGDIKSTVEKDVSQAQRTVKAQAAESAAALTQETKDAVKTAQSVVTATDPAPAGSPQDGNGQLPQESTEPAAETAAVDAAVVDIAASDDTVSEATAAEPTVADTTVTEPPAADQPAELVPAPEDEGEVEAVPEEAPVGAMPFAATSPIPPPPLPEADAPPQLAADGDADQAVDADEEPVGVLDEVAAVPAADEER